VSSIHSRDSQEHVLARQPPAPLPVGRYGNTPTGGSETSYGSLAITDLLATSPLRTSTFTLKEEELDSSELVRGQRKVGRPPTQTLRTSQYPVSVNSIPGEN
jgi:hypothetical protein